MMEEHQEENVKNRRKRVRDDSTGDSTESKLARVESPNNSVDYLAELNPDLSNSDSTVNSPEAKRIQDELLSILDESDPDPAIQGLDSVIKSFEEEILFPGAVLPTMMSESSETRPELGYLLEASDDELGLSSSFSPGDENKKIEDAFELKITGSGSAVGLDDIGLGFDDGVLSFEPYRFGIGVDLDNTVNNNVSNDFITLGGGLFDSYEPVGISDFTWLPESLPTS